MSIKPHKCHARKLKHKPKIHKLKKPRYSLISKKWIYTALGIACLLFGSSSFSITINSNANIELHLSHETADVPSKPLNRSKSHHRKNSTPANSQQKAIVQTIHE